MHTISEYLGTIEKHLKEIKYPENPAGLYDPIAYTLNGGGKRLRPMLVLATCEAFGGDVDKAINQALAVEMFHNFTLLHDDVMDDADMRRGRPTVHVRWDSRTAILSGDAMLTLSGIISRRGCTLAQAAAVAELMDRTAMEVYDGQQYDMDFENRADVTVDDYINMIRLKTSVLLGCACQLGAVMANADPEQSRVIYEFGVKLGLAFQLRDDYLDTYGDPIIFGKEIGGDIINDKKTWLSITAMQEDADGVMQRELSSPSEPKEKIENVRGVYDRLHLAERCHQLINRYVDEAVAELDKLELTPAAKDFFVQIAENSRTRTH
ncbi:MAG: polyprenyl synthetase family protein [Bacteroides sp.]|nr:polyprenyl synthetase family protein [Bacteroides sp.]MCM1412863.1 polyprenyl synthetase family protein [Bacteroides sp.]MCM1471532.1 polyprenyl synthetase family protein [Bacteroides sp.]